MRERISGHESGSRAIDRDQLERILCGPAGSGRMVSLISGHDAVEPDDTVDNHEAVGVAPDVILSRFEDGAAYRGGEDAVEAREKLRAGTDVRPAC